MRRSLLWIYTLLFALICCPVLAQDYPMLHYGIEDGLPSNRIYEVYRDKKGFLWIGTDKGVARYNGIKFEKYTTSDGLADNDVFFFQEDNYGRLWLASANGELCYFKNGMFHNKTNTPFLKLPFKSYYPISINVEPDSSVTVCFSEQPFFVNIVKNGLKTYYLNTKYNNDFFSKLNIRLLNIEKFFYSDIEYVEKYGNGYKLFCQSKYMYTDSAGKILKYDKIDEQNLRFHQFGQDRKFFYNMYNIRTVAGDTIKKFPPGFFPSSKNVSKKAHRFYSSGNLFFVATDEGLFINDTNQILRGKNTTSITQDISGNYWAGTMANGLFYLNKNSFSSHLYKGAYEGVVRYSAFKRNHLFFGTIEHIIYELANDKVNTLYQAPARPASAEKSAEPGILIDDDFRCYLFSPAGNFVIDNILNKHKHIDYYLGGIFSDNIKSIYYQNDCIYVQNRLTINKLDYSKAKPNILLDDISTDVNSIKTSRVFSSALSSDNKIWYSTRSNIFKVLNGDSAVLQPQFSNMSFLAFEFLGSYLVGTSHDNKIFICNNFEHNILTDSISGRNNIWDKLFKIDSTHLLISTNSKYCLLTLYPSSGKPKYELLTIENPIVPLNAESICSDGVNCYFFKGGDITAITINTLLGKIDPPALLFQGIKIKGQFIPVDNNISIPFENARNLTISFSTISFGSKDVSYQYSLSKNDSDNWTPITGEEINMVNPSFGDYTIKVKAKTLSSAYSVPIVFTLHIERPFWASWWFITIAVIIIGCIIVFFVRQRVLALINKREKEHGNQVRFMKSEYKALNALMNPHFIFNTLNNVQSLINGNNKIAANEYLRIFADLIRQNMHNVSKELIPLQKEIDLVSNYLLLEKLRFEDKLNYALDIDDDVELHEIMVPPLLIQPLVENSVKHGILELKSSDGFIKINIFERENVLYIEVLDNGVGLKKTVASNSFTHESFGLENIRKRVEQLSIIQNKEMTFTMTTIVDEHARSWTKATVTMII